MKFARIHTTCSLAILVCASHAAHAQSNVTPTAKSCWGENIGWMNWRDAGTPAGSQGAVINLSQGYLTGMVWGENVGWINLGAPGVHANTNGTNFGVNIDPCGYALSGMAWGENIGWINFAGGAMASPPNPARFDPVDARLRGFAWGENVGWINFDAPTDVNGKVVGFAIVGPTCDCIDFNRDGLLPDIQDIADFLSVFAGAPCPTPACGDIDFNNDGLLPDTLDIDSLLSVFSGGPCL